MNKSILITGANAGLGKETARQLALKPETEKIILACRNANKADAAKNELEESTGKDIFEILIIDVSDEDSVKQAVSEIEQAHLQGKKIIGIYTHGSKETADLPDAFNDYGGVTIGWNSIEKLGEIIEGDEFPVEAPNGAPATPKYTLERVNC